MKLWLARFLLVIKFLRTYVEIIKFILSNFIQWPYFAWKCFNDQFLYSTVCEIYFLHIMYIQIFYLFFIFRYFNISDTQNTTYHRFFFVEVMWLVKMLRLTWLLRSLIFLPQSSVTNCPVNRHLSNSILSQPSFHITTSQKHVI